MTTTIEAAQHQIDSLLRVVQTDLDRRGVLMIDRAQLLVDAVKRAKLTMALCEQTTPSDFLNAKWGQQATALRQLETRLSRIIRGTRVPIDDHEATIR
jgi:hypothetical protein